MIWGKMIYWIYKWNYLMALYLKNIYKYETERIIGVAFFLDLQKRSVWKNFLREDKKLKRNYIWAYYLKGLKVKIVKSTGNDYRVGLFDHE